MDKPIHPSDKRWLHLFVWMPWIGVLLYFIAVVIWYREWAPDVGYRNLVDGMMQMASFIIFWAIAVVSHIFNKFYLLSDLPRLSHLTPGNRGLLVVMVFFAGLIGAPIYYYLYLHPRSVQNPPEEYQLDL